MSLQTKPTVLLTNDDGPPSAKHSPFVFGLYQHLRNLGWNVKVVLPSSQKSWIGKAFHITEITKGRYYYPTEPDGLGETSPVSRPLRPGEIDEWILLDGTPATCANVAIHNIYAGQIDLVVSGPNLGRNTSTAFAMSSGTIGAALSGALCRIRAIAVSYGIVENPPPPSYTLPAHILAARILVQLYSEWGCDPDGQANSQIDLYNVNIPLIDTLLKEEEEQKMKVYWTRMWRNAYGRLFKSIPATDTPKTVKPAGPDASDTTLVNPHTNDPQMETLVFKFSPDLTDLIPRSPADIPEGTDGWAIHSGCASITPMTAGFAEPDGVAESAGKIWKMKL